MDFIDHEIADASGPACFTLHPDLEARRADDRLDLVVRGRVRAEAPIEAITLEADGALHARLSFPPAEDAPGACDFMFMLSRPSAAVGPVTRLVLTAALAGAQSRVEQAIVHTPADGPTVLQGADQQSGGEPHETLSPPLRIHPERIEIDAGGSLALSGWVVSRAPLRSLTVHAGETSLGSAETGLGRDDVARFFPGYADPAHCGFRFAARAPAFCPGERLRLAAIAEDGTELDLYVPLPGHAAGENEALRLMLDSPPVRDGMAAEAVSGRLAISGWAVAASGIERIEVRIDGGAAGLARHGVVRPDVAAALPGWPGALRGGFHFVCPPRLLKPGAHTAEIAAVSHAGARRSLAFAFAVRSPGDAPAPFEIRRRLSEAERAAHEDTLRRLRRRPAFALLLPLRASLEVAAAAETLASLVRQPYDRWRLILLCAGDAIAGEAAAFATHPCARVAVADDAPLAGGETPDTLFALLAPGDALGADALIEMAVAAGLDPQAELLSCDESRLDPASGLRTPFLKPGFSPDLLLAANYLGRFFCVSAGLLARAGVTGRTLLEGGEHDLALRCAEGARGVRHVPRVLLRRGPAEEPSERGRAALKAAAARRGRPAELLPGLVPATWRARPLAPVSGRVSVLIPTCGAGEHVFRCIETLRASTAPGRIEIVCIENVAAEAASVRDRLRAQADRVIEAAEPFNWARFANRAAAAGSGEFFLFLNDDVEAREPGWLEALLEPMAEPEVGIAGARLLYPDGRVQHAGMFLTRLGLARHAFRFADAADPGYCGLALTTRNVIAVTGAAMLVRRRVFETLGGFDEAHAIINNDLDFCLRAHEAGHRIVHTPHATLIHHEMASRAHLPERFDAGRFAARWRARFEDGDPYLHPLIGRESDELAPENEPAELVAAGHPLFRRADIRAILAIKLDHIGDFQIAVPALERLRALFPAARIVLLAAADLAGLAAATGLVDAVIPFAFFHARSSRGPREISPAELADLRARLAGEAFDLAIDLRKHADAREVLRESGARLLAGFDHLGQFPWLDIALEWEGDRPLHPKRNHVGADLLNLVEAVGAASTPLADAAASRVRPPAATLPGEARALFDGQVVCVHPGVGNPMRQWPMAHFTSLIDLLTGRLGAGVLLIGGEDEAALGEALIEAAADPGRVVSLIGRLALDALPGLLGACDLFVGNNSGPQHIAAAAGVPTLGIHSGVVDVAEWAPIGPRALAIRRDMSCGPCYLARPEDCHRGLACLTGLAPETVFAACRRLLAGDPW